MVIFVNLSLVAAARTCHSLLKDNIKSKTLLLTGFRKSYASQINVLSEIPVESEQRTTSKQKHKSFSLH